MNGYQSVIIRSKIMRNYPLLHHFRLAPKTQDSNKKCQEGTRLRPGGKICEGK